MESRIDVTLAGEQHPDPRYVLETIKVANRSREDRRCVCGVRFAGERTECPYYVREAGSDDE